MKKTAIITLVVILVAALAAGAIVYFRPHKLTDRIAENDLLYVTCTTLGAGDGAAHNDTQTWENVAVTKDILDLLDEYTFRRSLPFSDSGMTPREKLLVISVYEGGALIDSVIISDSGELSAGGANYIMNGADAFIGEFINLIDTPGTHIISSSIRCPPSASRRGATPSMWSRRGSTCGGSGSRTLNIVKNCTARMWRIGSPRPEPGPSASLPQRCGMTPCEVK